MVTIETLVQQVESRGGRFEVCDCGGLHFIAPRPIPKKLFSQLRNRSQEVAAFVFGRDYLRMWKPTRMDRIQ